jgi:hypothetical protein
MIPWLRITQRNPFFAARGVNYDRGDAPMQIRLPVHPVAHAHRVDQAGRDPFARRVDNLRAGGHLNLSSASDRRDAIALDDDDGGGHRCAAIAVDQGAALDNDRLKSLALRRYIRTQAPHCKGCTQQMGGHTFHSKTSLTSARAVMLTAVYSSEQGNSRFTGRHCYCWERLGS